MHENNPGWFSNIAQCCFITYSICFLTIHYRDIFYLHFASLEAFYKGLDHSLKTKDS